MAIAAPAMVVVQAGQDATVTVDIPTDTTGWEMTASLKTAMGTAALVTKTVGSGIVNNPGSSASTAVITYTAADLAGLQPGGYWWNLERTNTGFDFPITSPSTFRITGAIAGTYPQFTNLSELCAHLGIDPTGLSDADVQFYLQIMSAAETLIHSLCGRRQFFYATYTEFLTAPNRGPLLIRETPITSITSINIDGQGGFGQLTNSFGSNTLLTAGQDYYFVVDNPDGKGYSGQIVCLSGNGWGFYWGAYLGNGYGWGNGGWGLQGMLAGQPQATPGAVKVVYVGGYALIPDDLKLAVWQIVADRKAARQRGIPFASESGMNYSYSLGNFADEMLKVGSVASIIAKYRDGSSLVAG